METQPQTASSSGLEEAAEAFVPGEISSTTFQHQTPELPPNSLLIEMQINLRLITLPLRLPTRRAVTRVCELPNK